MQLFVNSTVLRLLLSVVCGLSCGLSVVAIAASTGNISGNVNYCDRGGVLGMKISLSGRQASILTAADGQFLFEEVPPGRYALFYSVGDNLVHVTEGVAVRADETTSLGEIVFCAAAQADQIKRELQSDTASRCAPQSQEPECVDNDSDGVVAAQDCDDGNDQIRPGAPEQCDGLDNNCNGKIDDLGGVWVENGEGVCQNGQITVKSCQRGFADCDGKADNGCEVDLMRDNDNCGACGNACPSLEICVAGIC